MRTVELLPGHSHVKKFQLCTVPEGHGAAGSGDDLLQRVDGGSHTGGTGVLGRSLGFWYMGAYLW